MIRVGQPCHLGWTGGFAISTPGTSASSADQLRQLGWTGDCSSTHQPRYVATSSSQTLFLNTSEPAWGLGPRPGQGLCLCPTISADPIINTEHTNQLSRFHAQFVLMIKFCSVRPIIIPFWQKVICEKFPCQNIVCGTKIQIHHLLGGFLYEVFPLAYDYTCMASFLVRVLRHNMHHVDLSVPQARLPCFCVYPYAPDCSARE